MQKKTIKTGVLKYRENSVFRIFDFQRQPTAATPLPKFSDRKCFCYFRFRHLRIWCARTKQTVLRSLLLLHYRLAGLFCVIPRIVGTRKKLPVLPVKAVQINIVDCCLPLVPP